ncbi:hypothetical protein [Actinomadura rugatobispora]|uniref:Uncharacterized protein n=1 Tax=Actinomadura rugatobispora TaxID=1994 RepID=A0ABW1A3F0_9ACTN|nr:hypothetical protein GCM10010200_037730 [Actinomadura rugatobispora]
MTSTMRVEEQVKEEFYLRRAFDDDTPVFVDATRHVRQGLPYPLSAKKALKATCAVWTDNEVVAFSLRHYTAKQAEREVEHVESSIGVRTVTSRNVLRPRMPRRTLRDLNETARALAAVIGDDVIVELDGELYVLALTRRGNVGELRLTGRLARTEGGYVRSGVADGDGEFELPVQGLRLRVFLRSPVRERVIAYAFGGYLTRRPGEVETVTRATALTLNSLLGLATFRMLSGLGQVEVPPRASGTATRRRRQADRVEFAVPVQLFTGNGPPAVIGSSLGADAVRDIAYDIMLGDLGHVSVAGLRAATHHLPGLAATPSQAEVRPRQPAPLLRDSPAAEGRTRGIR